MNFEFSSDGSDEIELGFLKTQANSNTSSNQTADLHQSTRDLLSRIKGIDSASTEMQTKTVKKDEERYTSSADIIDLSQPEDSQKGSSVKHQQEEQHLSSSQKVAHKSAEVVSSQDSSTSKVVGEPVQEGEISLVIPNTFKKRSTMLVQLEDNDMDLSGDVGAIGRLHSKGTKGVVLDIKGYQYVGEIVPCGSFMVVGVHNNEAKIESVVNDFCQISGKKNVFDSMQVLSKGTLDDSYKVVGEEDVNYKSREDSNGGGSSSNAVSSQSKEKSGTTDGEAKALKRKPKPKQTGSAKKKRKTTATSSEGPDVINLT